MTHEAYEVWVPPYDDWAKAEERDRSWFITWRNSESQLGFDFLYQDGQKRPDYPRRDDWHDQDGREHQPARSGGEETKGSTPSGTNAKSHFRHVLGPRRNEAKAQAACGSQSWRQNIDALKESERAIRRRTNAVESGKKHAGLGGDLLSESEVSELREELQKMENQCRQEESRLSAAAEEAEHGRKDAGYFQSEGNGELREEQRPSGEEERSSTSESLAEARRLADFWKKRAEEAEYRAWSMAEAMNELALVADERYVEALEKQLLLKQQLTSAEHRCEAFLEVWESVVEMSGPVQKEEGRSSLP